MARKRMISTEFWTDDKVIELSIDARLLFIGMWNFADDEGIMCYKPKQIKAQIFPVDDITHEQVNEMLVRIHEVGLIQFGNNNTLIRITNWTRYQKINRPTPSNYTFRKGIIEDSVNTHESITPSIGKVSIGKNRLEKNSISPQPKKVSSSNLLPYKDKVENFYKDLANDVEYLCKTLIHFDEPLRLSYISYYPLLSYLHSHKSFLVLAHCKASNLLFQKL